MASRRIDIDSEATVGFAVRIPDGVTVGDGAVLAAGCAVAESVPAVAAVAARPIGVRAQPRDDRISAAERRQSEQRSCSRPAVTGSGID